ncbi:MAG: tetratricopeptide repeat protein [Ardenticatenaceae bacterium]|nr:tetratricopeptide repeat protein [Ardenticatenaceae bacterium]
MMVYNGRYILHELLGVGGMGRVYKATDRLTGDIIALKQVAVPKQLTEYYASEADHLDGKFRLALTQEFKILASLRHPYIIPVVDYGFDEQGVPFFTMPYVSGSATILKGCLHQSNEQKYRWLIEIFEALAYLHQRGIIHRDLKPENILLTDGQVQLLDFGLSAAKAEVTDSVGSWAYVAPEVVAGANAVESSDLYAIGIIAFQMFAGRHPFDVESSDLIDQILDESPPLAWLKAPDSVKDVIGRLLNKTPEARFATARAAIAALCEAIGEPLPPEEVEVRESYLQAAAFIGREPEVAHLTGAIQSAMAGQGSAWLIGGESGVGKSRLADELRILSLVQGALVVQGNTVETGARPFQIWVEVIRRLALNVTLDPTSVSILQAIAPDLPDLLAVEPAPLPQVSQEVARRRLIHAVVDLFAKQTQWILLILEDLHWLTDSFELLDQLAEQANHLPVLIMATYRTENRADLAEKLAGMNHLTLARLNQNETIRLTESMLGKIGKNPALVDLLHRETEGNVFFLVEMVRALAEDAGRLTAVNPDSLPQSLYPQGIATLVARRLAHLSIEVKQLLQYAAGLGRVVDLPVVGFLNAQNRFVANFDTFLTACSNAAVLEFINGEWRFTHDKIRQYLLTTLSEIEHVQLHHVLAQTIMGVYPDDPSVAARLVYHWRQTDEVAHIRHFERIAGLYAKSLFSNEDAIRHLSSALELMAQENLSGRLELLEEREEVYDLLGLREPQLEDLTQIEQIVQKMVDKGEKDLRASFALRRARYDQTIGQFEKAIRHSQDAMWIAQKIGDSDLETTALISRGLSRLRLSQFEEAITDFEIALDLSTLNGLHRQEAEAMRFLGVAHTDRGESQQAAPFLEMALKKYRQIDDRQGESIVLNNLANVSMGRGDYQTSRQYFDEALKINEEIGDREGVARIYSNLTSLYLDVGEMKQAETYGQQALALCRQINVPLGVCFNLLNLIDIYLTRNQLEKSEEAANEAIAVARKMGSPHLERFALLGAGHALASLKKYDDAEDLFSQVENLFDQENEQIPNAEARVALADIVRRRGNSRQALQMIGADVDLIMNHPTLQPFQRPFKMIDQVCQILKENGRQEPYHNILTLGYQELIARNRKISDARIRQTHIQNIPAHLHLIEAYEAISKPI